MGDDDLYLRTMLRQIFEIEQFQVIDVDDGQKAIDYIKNNPVDILITDLIMPKKEGIETINELKNLFPDLPVFAMSGGSMTNAQVYLDIAQTLGVMHTFLKPFNINEMLDAVKSVISERNKQS